VFPLRPRDKIPFKGSQGFYDATDDEDEVERWWLKDPNANIGVRTGSIHEGGSGVWSLDFDTDESKDGLGVRDELVAKVGALPGVLLKTARGVQYVFLHDDRAPSRCYSTKQGVDVRSDGGYFVAPPSIHPSGARYEWGD